MKKLTSSNALFLHRVLNGLAKSAIGIFIQLLIYKQTESLFLCFLYAVVNFSLTGIFFLLLKKSVQKNPIICIIIHIIPLIAGEFLLLTKLNVLMILLLAVLNAVATMLYYGSLNYLFCIMDNDTNTAKFETGQHIGKIIFAVISVYLIGELKNSLVFVIVFSLVLYIISIIPLVICYKDFSNKKDVPTLDYKVVLKDTKKYNIFHIFTGVFSLFNEVVLPLYLYVMGLSYTVVGLLVVVQYIVSIFANYLTKFMKKKNLNLYYTIICSFLIFASLTFISFSSSALAIYIVSLLITMSYQVLFTSYFDDFIKDQKEKGYFYSSVFYRDTFQNFARVGICGLYFVIPSFTLMFFVGIASSIGIGISGTFCLKRKKYCDNELSEIVKKDKIKKI